MKTELKTNRKEQTSAFETTPETDPWEDKQNLLELVEERAVLAPIPWKIAAIWQLR